MLYILDVSLFLDSTSNLRCTHTRWTLKILLLLVKVSNFTNKTFTNKNFINKNFINKNFNNKNFINKNSINKNFNNKNL